MDGLGWEIHFLRAVKNREGGDGPRAKRAFARVAHIGNDELGEIAGQTSATYENVDERIIELAAFLTTVKLPFPAADKYEYWLLDANDESPLALIFSCTEAEYMALFPSRPEWTALPAAVMPVDTTQAEKDRCEAPVNYRVERLVASRAGFKPRARWFQRRPNEPDSFPAFLLSEDWVEEDQRQLCQRYLKRQSTRLLMLHGLQCEERRRLELAARPYALEVERFFPLYPEIADERIINAIRAEARLRGASGEQVALLERRDGVLYQ